MAKRKIKKVKTKNKGMYLVSWKGMQKDTEIPLPMRPFSSYQEAECYALGCADVVCVASNSDLKWEDVMRDFIITQD